MTFCGGRTFPPGAAEVDGRVAVGPENVELDEFLSELRDRRRDFMAAYRSERARRKDTTGADLSEASGLAKGRPQTCRSQTCFDLVFC
jgi:hypothetical protein